MINSYFPVQRRVLVADDERSIADTLQLILSQNGFEVAVTYDGESAIEKARLFNPKIFLCDVMMPGVSGLEAAIQMRALIHGCRILLFSRRAATFDLIQEGRLLGHEFELLLKPIHPFELLDRFRS